jgi:hypothetical protein
MSLATNQPLHDSGFPPRASPRRRTLRWRVALPPSALVSRVPPCCWGLAASGAGVCLGMPGRDALALVLLVSRSCTAGAGFPLVTVRRAFGGLVCSGLCCVWFLLVSVPVGLRSSAAFSASDVFCAGLCCWHSFDPCVCLSVFCLLSSPLLPFPSAILGNTQTSMLLWSFSRETCWFVCYL